MPAKSKKQQRFMGMCAHDKNPPKHCPPRKVAHDFSYTRKGYINSVRRKD